MYRTEDLDAERCKPEFHSAAMDDLRWLGLDWDEGPDVGGPHAPYVQSQRHELYLAAWHRLHAAGVIYPSRHTRRQVREAQAGQEDDGESLFPARLRPPVGTGSDAKDPGQVNWRFRVPQGRALTFLDGRAGPITRTAGVDFSDFMVWRHSGAASYELAVVVDDHAMAITEVVRGEDLLTSTARQLLVYEALGVSPPAFFHCPLVRDETGKRLAKRFGGHTLRGAREAGVAPSSLRSPPGG